MSWANDMKLILGERVGLYDEGDTLTLDAIPDEDSDQATHRLTESDVLELRDSLHEWLRIRHQRKHPEHDVINHSANFPCERCRVRPVVLCCRSHDTYLCGVCEC